ncbi:hypothetical protein [Paenibacillus sp. 1P07SE]|uniref:hypothetical protein n=1 Tax=Paenibacillus sp. 1P07SE TaxID=3132209 RepID=UPI0039A40916
MYNKKTVKMLLVMVAMTLALLGCSNQEPKEAVQNAFANSMLMKSYTFSGSMALDELTVPPEAMGSNGPEAAAIINTLKGAQITVDGAYQENPMRMEMTMKLALQGDFSMTIEVPMIMTEDKMYIRIPTIPMIPMEGLSGRFIEIDMNQLAEEEGGVAFQDINMDTARKMIQDFSAILLKHYEEGDYFAEVNADELRAMPEGVPADQIVKFAVTQDNIDDFVTKLVQHVVPEILDVIANNEEYKTTLQLTDAEIEEARTELQVDNEELQSGLNEMKESLVINEINTVAAIEDEYIRYQEVNFNVDIMNEGQTMTLGFFTTSQYNNINEEIEFQLEIPTDAIPLEELENMGPAMQGL